MNRGIFNFPQTVKTEQWFYAFGAAGTGSATKNWQQWDKPQGCQFVSIFCLGAGGGGGNGHSAAAAAARGGGGGGGSGAFVKATFLASMLPCNLWLQVPKGGNAAGGRAIVSVCRSISTADQLLISGAADAGAGGNGTGAAAGALGAAGTTATATTAGLTCLAIDFFAQAGQAGVAGGAHTGANGTNASTSLSMCIGGGAGGGGTTSADFAGGSVLGIGSYHFARPTIAGGAAGSNPGSGGLSMFGGMFLHTGGSGGGSSNTGVGGAGGPGGYGSGGGGGGGGTTGGTGGAGGDGLIIIATW